MEWSVWKRVLNFRLILLGNLKDDVSRGWVNVGLRAVGRVGRILEKVLLEAVSEKFDPGNRGGMIYSTI
jgi:hypothetical protein